MNSVRQFFAYVRVSTAKQGEHGVSLQEQRDAITRYAERHGLEVSAWFEERQTAAKRGRPVFTRMLKLLTQGKAAGVIIHKIDRSARNLKDWADLGELIDRGIEVHFANESLDLHSRGGRLSADIQAVVAADYIRNLRDETRKGFYGRLKQGLYPLPAPLGYLDGGKGKPKEQDPAKASLVRKAFELYATARYNLHTLAEELWRLGLRNRRGGRVSVNGLSVLLNNPFYVGLIRLHRTGETFPGAHRPLVTKTLFDRVRGVLTGKTNTRVQRHHFLFRRLLACETCGYALIGERQKGRVYYRCHTRRCPRTCVREDGVEGVILQQLLPLQLSDEERAYAARKVAELGANWKAEGDARVTGLRMGVGRIDDRLNRLTDAYLDGMLEKPVFEERRATLLLERKGLEEALEQSPEAANLPDRLAEYLELAGSAYSAYKRGFPEEKRELLTIITSNRVVSGKTVQLMLNPPFREIENRFQNANGGPYRDTPRTWDQLIPTLWHWFEANPTTATSLGSDPLGEDTNPPREHKGWEFAA